MKDRRVVVWAAVATVCVVILAVVIIAGWVVNGRNQAGQTTPPSSQTPSGAPTPTRPQDGSGSPSVDATGPAIPPGEVDAGAGGATTSPEGIQLRYPHTQDGAVAAATNYMGTVTDARVADGAWREKVAAQISSRVASAGVKKSLDESAAINADAGVTAMHYEPPRGAYAVKFYTPERATIFLWHPVRIVTKDPKSPAAGTLWSVDVMQLVWENGDWKADNELPADSASVPDPADPEGIPTPQAKYAILKYPNPEGPSETLGDYWMLSWREYHNAAR